MMPKNICQVNVQVKKTWRSRPWLAAVMPTVTFLARFHAPVTWLNRTADFMATRVLRNLKCRIGNRWWRPLLGMPPLRDICTFSYQD